MLQLINVNKHFSANNTKVNALSNINLSVAKGDVFGVIGQSGAGKSTLVRCMNLLERPSTGTVLFGGVNLTLLSKKQLLKYQSKIGMVFQQFNLLEQRTVLSNVCFPLKIAGVKRAEAIKKATEMLEIVGLKDKLNAYPSQLSGGQKQRVAIARALVNKPQLLLCDEATSALDPATTSSILKLLKEINQKLQVTVVIITHEMSIVKAICNRVAILNGGEIVETGETAQVFKNPKTLATQELIGKQNVLIS